MARAARERIVEDLLRQIQVAFAPPRHAEHVQRLAEGIAVIAQLGRRHGSLRAVGGGVIVGVYLIAARDPAHQLGRKRR